MSSRRVMKHINTGVANGNVAQQQQQRNVSPVVDTQLRNYQQSRFASNGGAMHGGSYTARNNAIGNSLIGVMGNNIKSGGPSGPLGQSLIPGNSAHQPNQQQKARTIRSTTRNAMKSGNGGSSSQTRQTTQQAKGGSKKTKTPELGSGKRQMQVVTRSGSNQSKSADENSRKRSISSNAAAAKVGALATPQSQYMDYRVNSQQSISNKSTSAGGGTLWKNGSKLMREPDQVGSQIIRLGNNSSTMFPGYNNNHPGGSIKQLASDFNNPNGGGGVGTQSNQFYGLSDNYSPLKQQSEPAFNANYSAASGVDGDKPFYNQGANSVDIFGSHQQMIGGAASGASAALSGNVYGVDPQQFQQQTAGAQSHRGFGDGTSHHQQDTSHLKLQLQQQLQAQNPSIFNVSNARPANDHLPSSSQLVLISEQTQQSSRGNTPVKDNLSAATRSKISLNQSQENNNKQYHSPSFFGKQQVKAAGQNQNNVKTTSSQASGKKQKRKKQSTNQLVLQASMGTQRAHTEVERTPSQGGGGNEILNAIKIGAACMQLIKLTEKKQQRAEQRRFEKWKFNYLGSKEGFHVITQTKHLEMTYSNSDLKVRLQHDQQSADSKSFYTDFSAASLKSASIASPPANGLLTHEQVILTKSVAALLRFKSRKIANYFWRWKYYSPILIGGRSTIHGVTQQTNNDNDSEVADLIQKYKLFCRNEPSAMGSQTDLVTEENIDDGDEATISNQKKQEFEQPVQYAGPENRDQLFAPEEEVPVKERKIDPTKKPDDGTPKPQIFYQILNSKNKDFGGILRTSNSASSVISYEEIGGARAEAEAHQAVDIGQVTSTAFAKSKAVSAVQKFLGLRLKHALKLWRSETDDYLSEIKFKLRTSKMRLMKDRVVKLMAIKVANEKAILREAFHAFGQWRLETQVDKRALDRRQQLFMINNAKLEVQRSKAALQSLYRQQRQQSQQPTGTTPAGSMLVLHPVSQATAVQTSFDNGLNSLLMDPVSTRNQVQAQIKDQLKNMCYDMLQEVAKEVHSNQGGSTLDHGEGVDTSHMSVSTTDLPQATTGLASSTNANLNAGLGSTQGLLQLGGATPQQTQYAARHHHHQKNAS